MRSSIDLCNDNEHPETHSSAEHEITLEGDAPSQIQWNFDIVDLEILEFLEIVDKTTLFPFH